ncbi:MAG: integrase arm-type DNA-binding domain-containing protein [Betaproteobacteria bacterium]|nr:integrase arm-type DNA-binding domain-containing protein [Betaproteobacteria bacterium]
MRGIEKLSASRISSLLRPGKYSDGGGLYLQVTRGGTKSWIFRYIRQGAERNMGLGALHAVGLEEARVAAHRVRSRLAQGFDPLQERLLGGRLKANDKTFDECVAAYIARHRRAWRSAKHEWQWEQSLLDYASPHFGRIHVRIIDTAHVLQALEPIWVKRIETASRLRGRIERVLAWATVSGYREGENPARWKGHLQELLPPPAKIKQVRHYPSMPYREIGTFINRLTARKGDAARALAFTILTACRSGEVREARWEEIDLGESTWTIPAERMKAGKEHRVPLTPAMLGILRGQQGRDAAWVFPGNKPGSPLSGDAILAVLRRMGSKVTVHGFRSSFRVWSAECTSCPKEVPEMALAHTVGSAVEAAYQRSDLFGRRRALMQAWSDFCTDVKNTNA